MEDNSNYIDVEFENLDEQLNKEINGEPFYYKTSQVAKILGENDSTIRYWTTRFDDILNVAICNKARAYTKTNIEQLKFIKKLAKEDGFTLKQIEEYCSEKGFNQEGLVDQSKPLAIKVVTEAIMEDVNKQLLEFEQNMIKNMTKVMTELGKTLINTQQESNETIKEQLALTIDDVVTTSMNEKLENIKESIKSEISSNIENNKTLKCIEENISKSSENNEKLISEMIKQKEESDNKLQDVIKESSKKEEERDEKLDKMNRDIERSLRIQEQIAELREMEAKKKGFWNRLFK